MKRENVSGGHFHHCGFEVAGNIVLLLARIILILTETAPAKQNSLYIHIVVTLCSGCRM